MFKGPFDESIINRAREKGIVEIRIHDLRDYSLNKHRKVDDYPYGGGAGMVMRPEPFFRAVEAIDPEGSGYVILLTPQGERFSQTKAAALAKKGHLILLCGHYEGVDERVRKLADREISIGDFVLTGGEIPAMVVVDCIVRLLPGVISPQSVADESFAGSRLEYPHYTRPPEFRGMRVPEVLLSGDHQRIADWRREQADKRTKQRRPDLMEGEKK